MRRNMFPGAATIALALAMAAVADQPAAAERCPADLARRTYPGKAWAVQPPLEAGWSAKGLNIAFARAGRSFSSGVLVHKGKIIAQFGDIAAPYETRSMRKAFLSAVIGQLVEEGKVDLDATLGELGIDDVTPLSDIEKTATVRHLLTARSGVYLPAAYVVQGDETGKPARGAHRPGEAFFYWNWGFNALGGVIEKVTGKSVFELFERRLARPLELQDFDRARDTRYVYEPVSRYPAYLFDISSRDRARIGLLYLNDGCWKGRQVVSRQWVADSVSPVTDQTGDFDYGYLWWSDGPPAGSGLTQRVFMARGFANQYIMGIPEIETVLVLSVDMSNGEEKVKLGLNPPTRRDYLAVLDLVIKARPGSSGS
jgi:CubicO group peptidase (beta-lactamase class C family)